MDLLYLNQVLLEISGAFNFVIAFFIIQIGVLFCKQWYSGIKKNLKNIIILGYGLFFTFFSLSIFIVSYLDITVLSDQLHNLYFISSILLRGVGGILFAFILEYKLQNVFRTRYLLTFSLIILSGIMPFIQNLSFFPQIINTFNLYLLSIPLFFTIYFIKNTYNKVQKKLIIAFTGIILFCAAIYLSFPRFETLLIESGIVLFSLKVIAVLGLALVFYGFNGYNFILESQWRKNLLELHIIDKDRNTCLYHRYFKATENPHDELLVEGLTGIERLVKEFTNASSDLDIINFENKLILLNHGQKVISALIVNKNLQNSRYILREITSKFEIFFWDYLKNPQSYDSWLTRGDLFKPMDFFIQNFIKL